MRFDRRAFLRLSAVGALGGMLGGTGCGRGNGTPNVVVILSDDQGWGDLSIHGNSNLSTPNIDSLARDGALLDNFFVCSVCAPTRAEFLTGRYHPRGGVRGVSTGAERLNLDERTIADLFKNAGYATGCFGKWHNGSQYPYHPNGRGFEEFYGFTSGHWGDYFDAEVEHNGEIAQSKGFLADDLTDHAIAFIEKSEKPFFCYLPLNTPHSPMQVPDRFYQKFANFEPTLRGQDEANEDIGMTRAALAMCVNIDWNVGRVLQTLDKTGKAEDTIIVYFGDNGPNSYRWNGGMKGRKGTLDEGGLKVPCLMRWKGTIPEGIHIDRIAGAIDLLPTLAGLAGIAVPATKPVDGVNLQPLLTRDKVEWPDRRIFTLHNNRASVRTQRYRLDQDGALFDMVSDPGQKQDIREEKPEIQAELLAAEEEWRKAMLLERGIDERSFPVGFAANTLLPARDGVPQGSIERSSRHPNCSFFTNWTQTTDSMDWKVEIGRPGRYEVALYYTCPADSTGSRIELLFGQTSLQAKVTEAHDPPLEGESEDRVPRTESYVKAFRPMKMGEITLPKSTGTLTLRAVEVSGQQVAEVRRIALRYLGA